jgi:hypothetical protein
MKSETNSQLFTLPSKMNHPLAVFTLCTGSSIVVGAILLAFATSINMGVSPDSTFYIGVARNLMHGNGLVMPVILQPLTHYPPLYPLLLSPAWLLEITATDWARIINILFFVGSILLTALISKQNKAANPWLPPLLFASSPALLEIHKMVWSEPPFIFFMLLTIYTIHRFFDKEHLGWLIGGAIAIALAWLTRFIGAALLVALFFILTCNYRKLNWRVIVSVVISTLPIACWLIYTFSVADDLSYRQIALRSVPVFQTGVLVLLLTMFFICISYGQRSASTSTVFLAMIGFFYIASLAVTVFLFDNTPVDIRLLSPVYALLFLLAGTFPVPKNRQISRVFLGAIIILMFVQFGRASLSSVVSAQFGNYQTDGSWSTIIPAHDWKTP